LVKNTTRDSRRTLARKLREAIGALRLERQLSKDQILSAYLNTAYFGNGAYGLGAAAATYFDKRPEALSLGEAAMLAGMVKAPSQLALASRRADAQLREQTVLRAMVRAGYVTPAGAASAEPATLTDAAGPEDFGGYFADWVYPLAARRLEPAYGAVQVRTTLDGDLQRRAEAAVRGALDAYGQEGRASQAALVAMRTDGRVVAMVGGRDRGASAFNRAVQARRQVGSTFKLFAYLAAFEQGADPESLVSDDPLQLGDWRPANADHENHGVLTLEDAFARSSNLAAIRVGQAVGIPAVIRTARELGITSPLAPAPSLPLGVSGVSLLELTSAYASVAAGVYPVLATGAPGAAPAGSQKVMDEAVRANMLRLLRLAAMRGGGAAADLPLPVYGKTGTSQNNRDALFVGFAGDLVVGVWVGNDDERPMNRVYGGALPARIWADFMRGALGGQLQAIEPEEPRGGFGDGPGPFGL
jgi:penicillin-binding protein 1A